MLFITNSNKTIINYPVRHDPQDEKYYVFNWAPETRQDSTEYLLNSVVIPDTPNGYYYLCVSPGISDSVEPTMTTVLNKTMKDGVGGLIWQAKGYDFNLKTGDTITASQFIPVTGITITDDVFTSKTTSCKVAITDPSLTSFILTNRVTITRDNTNVEILDRSINVTITSL